MVRGGETGEAVEDPCHGVTLPQSTVTMPEMWGRLSRARKGFVGSLHRFGSLARRPMAQRVEVLLANRGDVLVEVAYVPG